MGKASKAPRPVFQRSLRVTAAAVERYREILGRDHYASPDRDVMNRIEVAIDEGQPKWEVMDVDYPHVPTHVFELHAIGGLRYAVVRERCVVTMLPEALVQRNLGSGRWLKQGAPDDEPSPLQLAPAIAPRPALVPAPVASSPIAAPAIVTPEPEAIDSQLEPDQVRAALAFADAEVLVARRRRATEALAAELETARAELGKAEVDRHLAHERLVAACLPKAEPPKPAL